MDDWTPPYFPRFPDKYLSDSNVIDLTLEEEGAYNRLLVRYWQKGFIPNNPDRLANFCKVSQDKMREMWQSLRACFVEKEKGKLVHKRLEKHRQKLIERHRKKVEAGRKGGKAKAKKKELGIEEEDKSKVEKRRKKARGLYEHLYVPLSSAVRERSTYTRMMKENKVKKDAISRINTYLQGTGRETVAEAFLGAFCDEHMLGKYGPDPNATGKSYLRTTNILNRETFEKNINRYEERDLDNAEWLIDRIEDKGEMEDDVLEYVKDKLRTDDYEERKKATTGHDEGSGAVERQQRALGEAIREANHG